MKHSHGRMKSTPYRVDGVLRDFSQKRTSKIRYIRDTKSEVSTKVTERIRRLSGWEVGRRIWAGENYQIMNYGSGGVIGAHFDVVLDENQESSKKWREKIGTGPRLATSMITLR